MASEASAFGGQDVAIEHARLGRPQKQRIGDERREEQRELGEDGADHPA